MTAQQPWEPHRPDFAPHGHTWPAPPAPPGPPAAPFAAPAGPRGPLWTTRRKLAAAGAALALAVGAGSTGAAVAVALAGDRTVYSGPTAVSGASAKAGTVAQVAAAVQPSVVSIQAQTRQGTSGGSGVVLRPDGVIMTNAHVVSGSQQVTVKFSDGKTAPARVLGADTRDDIAVIKAEGVSGLRAATLGNSSALAVGDQVLAVGSPLGLDGSVTSGIVSALGRQIKEGDSGGGEENLPPGLRGQLSQQQQTVIENAIQTDAAINPGNSGGALVNAAGQVIGVNTAIATSGGGSGNIGVGFAIPVNSAKKVADQIIAGAQT
ncbi:trypsin-like peptidase domain-containing protein [Actinomadura graeca]|uniref:Trypsin-like peptidase domain-containing protein n=1 Tax=Actinomadura graeca TaxID=2750812 RepID=A0ABX8QYP0_9ACTN|nr:trypsin-like peptidase domain-containing protein [Actinomadura graeca]QXJ23926.1 trypsin-like peptidase domain-containing protein [Actinomadura graeca]